MKKTSRKAIAVIISAAMVFTSFATNVFAAGINDDSGVVMTQKDSDAEVSEQAYCGGTLKYKIESGNYYTDDVGGTEGTADAAYVAIFDATASTPTVVVDKILELSATEYNLGYWGDYYQFSGGVTPSINFDSEDITLPNGKYYVAVYVELNGTKYIYNNTESDEFVFVNPVEYPVPEVTKYTVGEKYEITYTIPTGTTGIVKLYNYNVADGKLGNRIFEQRDLIGDDTEATIVTTVTAEADQTVKPLLKLITEVGETKYRVPVKNVDTIETVNKKRDVVGEEVTAEYAEVEAPTIISVNGVEPYEENGNIYVKAEETSYVVKFKDAEAPALPPKTLEIDGTADSDAIETDSYTISSAFTAAENTYALKVYYNTDDTKYNELDLVLDSTPPTVTVEPITTTTDTITVNVTDTASPIDETSLAITVDGTAIDVSGATFADGVFTVPTALLKANNEVVAKAKDIVGNEGISDPATIVTAAEIKAPSIEKVVGKEKTEKVSGDTVTVDAKDAPYTVYLGDGENVTDENPNPTLPNKLFKLVLPNGTVKAKEVTTEGTITIDSGDYEEAPAGDYKLIVWYDGYETEEMTTTVTMSVIGDTAVTISVPVSEEGEELNEVAYNATTVSGTATPNSDQVEITVYALDEDGTTEIPLGTGNATVVADADEATWTVTLTDTEKALTEYIGKTIYAKAECSELFSASPAEYTVIEPEAPVITEVNFTFNDASEKQSPDADNNIYLKNADDYVVTLGDGTNGTPVPDKEFKANDGEYGQYAVSVVDGVAYVDLSTWTSADSGSNTWSVRYKGATAETVYNVVIDKTAPKVEISEVKDTDKIVTLTVDPDTGTPIVADSVIVTINGKDYPATAVQAGGTEEGSETTAQTYQTAEIPAEDRAAWTVGMKVTAVASDEAGNEGTAESAIVKGVETAITVVEDGQELANVGEFKYTVTAAEENRPLVATITYTDAEGTVKINEADLTAPKLNEEQTVKAGAAPFDASATEFGDGTYVITVKYADEAYDEDDLAGSITITVSKGEPATPITDPKQGDDKVMVIKGTANGCAKVFLVDAEGNKIDGTETSTTTNDEGETVFEIDLSTLDPAPAVGDVYYVKGLSASGVEDPSAPPAGEDNKYTVIAKDPMKKIELTTSYTSEEEGKYILDSGKAGSDGKMTIAVTAEDGYDVEVSIKFSEGTDYSEDHFKEVTKTITGSGNVEFEYRPGVIASYNGIAPEQTYTISAGYTAKGYEDKETYGAADITIEVTGEEAYDPQFDEPVTDRALVITGTTTGLKETGEEVDQTAVQEVELLIGEDLNWEDDAASAVKATVYNEEVTDEDGTVHAAGTWEYELTEALEAGTPILARLTNRGGKVSVGEATTTVVFAEVIPITLEWDDVLNPKGTTYSDEEFGFKMKADDGRNVVVKVYQGDTYLADWGGTSKPDGTVLVGAGEETYVDGNPQAADAGLAPGEWTVYACYEDMDAMAEQFESEEGLSATLTITKITVPGTPVLVDPETAEEVTNRTNVIEVTLGEFADTVEVAVDDTVLTAGTDYEVALTPVTAEDGSKSVDAKITFTDDTMQDKILYGATISISEVDKSGEKSQDEEGNPAPLELPVAYDEAITITITEPAEGDDRVINPADYNESNPIVISGETTEVYPGTTIIVSFVGSALSLSDATTTVGDDGKWTATFTYQSAEYAGLTANEGDYTVTAKVDDERPDVDADTYTQDEITITVDTTPSGQPTILGSKIGGKDVAGSVTTRSEEIYGTAKDAAGENYEPAGEKIYLVIAGEDDIESAVADLTEKLTNKETVTAGTDYAYEGVTTEPEEGGEGEEDAPNWRITGLEKLNVGDKVVAVLVDKAGNVSASEALTITDATAQPYALSIDDLENPYVNTKDEDSEFYQTLTFTGTSNANDGDVVIVHIEEEEGNIILGTGEEFNDKPATIEGGKWSVTFGGSGAEGTAVASLTEKRDGEKVKVSVSFENTDLTVDTESADTKTETYIYFDMTAPETPEITNEFISNRTTELTVESKTTYEFAEEEPTPDGGKITVYVDGEALTLGEDAAVFDSESGTWTITIPEQSAGAEITVTETDMAGNESDPTEAVIVEEAEADPEEGDPATGTVDPLVIEKVASGEEELEKHVEGEGEDAVDAYYVNNGKDQILTISGTGAAGEDVRLSLIDEDGKDAGVFDNPERTIPAEEEEGAGEWTQDVNLKDLSVPESADQVTYTFVIEYLNLENSGEEGVIGKAEAKIIIDVKAPEELAVDDIHDRDEEITGSNLEVDENGVPNEIQYSTDGGQTWTTVDPEKVTANEDGTWSIPKDAVGLDSGINANIDPDTGEGAKVQFKQVDKAGNESEPVEKEVQTATMDSEEASEITIDDPKDKAQLPNGTKEITVSGTGEPGEEMTVEISGSYYIDPAVVVDDDGNWSTTFSDDNTEFTVGTHTIIATYNNLEDGETTPNSVESTFIIKDANTPKPSGGGGGGGSSAVNKPIVIENVSNEDQPTISGKGEPNKEIEVFMINTKDPNNTNKTGDSIGKVKTDKNGNWSLEYPADLTPIEPGEYKVTAQYTLGENSYTGRTSAKFTVDPSNTAINNENDLLVVQIDNPKYYLNGKPAVMDSAPFIDENDRTMLPVRVVANALGISDADITWDDETKTATFTRADGVVVSCTVGSNVIKVGDQDMVIDTVPVIRNDRIYLPMRALFNAFNVSDAHIIWDGENRTVTVTKEALDDIAAVTAEAPEGE